MFYVHFLDEGYNYVEFELLLDSNYERLLINCAAIICDFYYSEFCYFGHINWFQHWLMDSTSLRYSFLLLFLSLAANTIYYIIKLYLRSKS